MRLFSALPLADEIVERLSALRLRWSAPGDGLRWSDPPQWHITLQFYGEVDEEKARCLEQALGRMHAWSPDLHMEQLGRFAAKGILFADLELSPALVRLHQHVLECGRACGFQPESRPFHPHITLARSKGKQGHATLHRLAQPSLPSLGSAMRWRAKELLLLESTLGPHGARYTVRSRFPLQTAAAPDAAGLSH